MRIAAYLLMMSFALAACNAPPLYESKARDFLRAHGVAAATIAKLEERVPLSSAEVENLSRFEHVLDVPMVDRVLQFFSSGGRIATLHLLAANPAAPPTLLVRLIAHPVEDVRWGGGNQSEYAAGFVARTAQRGQLLDHERLPDAQPGVAS
jgi:hypothetical protein